MKIKISLVRNAFEWDIPRLTELYQEFHEFHVAGVPQRLRIPAQYDIERMHATLTEYMRRPDIGLFVMERDAILIGFIEMHVREDVPDVAVVPHRYGHVQSLMVTATQRKTGAGRALFDAAKAWAFTQGVTQLRLDTWEFAEGPLHFYEHLGFHTIKREMELDITAMALENIILE